MNKLNDYSEGCGNTSGRLKNTMLMRKNLILALTVCSALTAFGQTEVPEEKVTELNEVVVKGKNAWIEGDKYVFKPTKSEKNLATDATSLLRNMDTGIIYVDGSGNLKSRLGSGNVNIFINGEPADEMDLSTFWPQNALRVEYMYSSTDPKFRGMTNIVNFIMKEYVVGGLTKFQVDQQFPNNGEYQASSKVVYKKMTYNAIVDGGYSRDHISYREETENFDDVWYDGVHYDRITLQNNSDREVRRNNAFKAGLNARYRTDKVSITHSAQFQWDQNPGSYSTGSVNYSPEIIAAEYSRSDSKGRTLAPSLIGNYYFMLSPKWSIAASWALSHSHNNNRSTYEEQPLPPIDTLTRENAYSAMGNVWGQFLVNPKMSVSAWVEHLSGWYFTDYGGYTDSHQRQRSGRTSFYASWNYRPSPMWSFSLVGQATYRDWNVNHDSDWSEWRPGVTGYVSCTLNQSNSFNLSGGYQPQSLPSSARTDLILRQTELKWLQGNNDIHTPIFTYVNLGYYYMPSGVFSFYAGVNYTSQSSSSMVSYRPGGKDYDGVIGRYENAGRENRVFAQFSPSVKLFNGALRISLECLYDHIHYTKSSHDDINFFQISPGLSWMFGNNMIVLHYRDRSKAFANGGSQVNTNRGRLSLAYTFGKDNLNVFVQIDDILNKHSRNIVNEYNGPYSMYSTQFGIGRNISVQVTYTFDYGKKVSPGIDISTSDTSTTSVLGSGR